MIEDLTSLDNKKLSLIDFNKSYNSPKHSYNDLLKEFDFKAFFIFVLIFLHGIL